MITKIGSIMKIKWKKTLKDVSFVILMLKMCVIFGQKTIIVIDLGHGGKDPGAIGLNNIQEKDVVLNIANEILRLNKTIFEGRIDIYLTRYKDTLVSLNDRTKLIKRLNADLFISLHCNYADNPDAKGIEVYVYNSGSRFIKESIELGLSVLNESIRKLEFKKRGVKFADFQVLRESIPYCPSILLEMGFISNTNEADYFFKTRNVRAMALTVLMGTTNYLNTGL